MPSVHKITVHYCIPRALKNGAELPRITTHWHSHVFIVAMYECGCLVPRSRSTLPRLLQTWTSSGCTANNGGKMREYLSHEVYCPSRRTRTIRIPGGVTTVRYVLVRVAIKHPFCPCMINQPSCLIRTLEPLLASNR